MNYFNKNKSSLIKYFSTADRVNLIHVAFELAYLGSKSYRIPSLLVEYMKTVEARNTPWQTFFWHINKIVAITEHRPSFKNLRVKPEFCY